MSDPQPKWRKVLVSGSNAHVAALTASAIANTHNDTESPGVEERVLVYNTSSGAFYYTGSYGSGGSSTVDGIFNVVTGTIFGITSSLQVTGSTIQQSPFTTTGANITASNAGTGGGTIGTGQAPTPGEQGFSGPPQGAAPQAQAPSQQQPPMGTIQ